MTDETQKLIDVGLPIVTKINERVANEYNAEAEKIATAILNQLEAEMRETIFGGHVGEQRMTAIRLRGVSFETVQLDKGGFIIEPLRCTCNSFLIINTCPIHSGVT